VTSSEVQAEVTADFAKFRYHKLVRTHVTGDMSWRDGAMDRTSTVLRTTIAIYLIDQIVESKSNSLNCRATHGNYIYKFEMYEMLRVQVYVPLRNF
jgi:hypothetical protein